MNIFALLAFAGFYLSGVSNGLYIYKRGSLPKDIPPKTVPETNLPSGNDEGSAAGFTPLDEPPLLLPLRAGHNSLEDFVNSIDTVETQSVAGYAPSPYVPFRVQVKARNSIPDSELSNVPNSEVSKADDPKGDAGTLTLGQKSDSPEGIIVAGASVPIPDTTLAQTSEQDKTQEKSSEDLTGAGLGLIASTVGVGLQGPDIPLEPAVNSDPFNNGLILGDGDIDQTLALAFADQAPSSGKNGAQLTDPFFANPNIPSLNSGLPSGSIFGSAITTGDSLFFDSVSDLAAAPPDGASTQASAFSPNDSAPGGDNNGNSNPNNQDESFLRNSEPVDWDDPCNLLHGSDTPFFKCTLTTSRTVLSPFKIPAVPRPDNDIAVDNIADVP